MSSYYNVLAYYLQENQLKSEVKSCLVNIEKLSNDVKECKNVKEKHAEMKDKHKEVKIKHEECNQAVADLQEKVDLKLRKIMKPIASLDQRNRTRHKKRLWEKAQ